MEDRVNRITGETIGGIEREKVQATLQQMDKAANSGISAGQDMRERTVAEYIDMKIWEKKSEIRALERLRENMSVSLLTMGQSTIDALLK